MRMDVYGVMAWTDARRPVPRLWIRSAEVRGGGGEVGWGRGGTSLGEWEHNKYGVMDSMLFTLFSDQWTYLSSPFG